jgi:hypothetical protein
MYALNALEAAMLNIRELLADRPGACRRLIESMLVFRHGFHPGTVTQALKLLTEAPDHLIVRTDFDSSHGKPCALYSIGEPDPNYVGRLTAIYSELPKELPIKLSKAAGEEYVRALLFHSDRFVGITQRTRLGLVGVRSNRLTLDLAATGRVTGRRFGISVKNQREFLFPGSRIIRDCVTRARAHLVAPWLFVPFATAEAISRCERDGVRLTVLCRRLLPAENHHNRLTRSIIEPLRAEILGDEPIDFVYRRFTRTCHMSPLVDRDLMEVSAALLEDAA